MPSFRRRGWSEWVVQPVSLSRQVRGLEKGSVKALLVNGSECEPYLTNDHRLMVERPEAILRGTRIVREKIGAEKAVIGVEMNKPDAIEAFRALIDPEEPVELIPLRVKYPRARCLSKLRSGKKCGREAPHRHRHGGQQRRHHGGAGRLHRDRPSLDRAFVTISGPAVNDLQTSWFPSARRCGRFSIFAAVSSRRRKKSFWAAP